MMRTYNSKITPSVKYKSDRLYISDLEKTSPAIFFSDKVIRNMIIKINDNDNIVLLDSLVNSFGKYVISIAKNYQEQGLSLGDLISEGMLGLLQSIKKFDVTNPTKFVTYSNTVISRYMREALDYNNNIVKLPKNIRNKKMKIKTLIHNMQLEGATEQEILEAIEVPTDFIYYYVPNLYSKKNIDELNENLTLSKFSMVSEDDPTKDLELTDLKDDIEIILTTKLTPQEADVIRYTFGIDLPYAVSSIKELSKKLGLSKAMIKSLRDSANQKLRDEKTLKILSKYI